MHIDWVSKGDQMTKRINVTVRNNSDARKFSALDGLSATARHNGGKLMIVTCGDADLAAVEAALDDSAQVARYEVVS